VRTDSLVRGAALACGGRPQCIDVSNPANPVLLGSYDTPSDATGITVSGAVAYVADHGSGLQIIDAAPCQCVPRCPCFGDITGASGEPDGNVDALDFLALAPRSWGYAPIEPMISLLRGHSQPLCGFRSARDG
jgi:LVIVD repeat